MCHRNRPPHHRLYDRIRGNLFRNATYVVAVARADD